jgi:hypothetical protein
VIPKNDPYGPYALDSATEFLRRFAKDNAIDRIEVTVRPDGRVTIVAEGKGAWVRHADLLHGGPLPLPSAAIKDLLP